MAKVLTIYDLFLTDPKMEKEGIIVKYGESEFVIARAGGKNKEFLDVRDKYVKNFKKGDQESSEEFLLNVWAESIIKSWTNVHDKEGKQLPFTMQNVRMVLKDLPQLFEDLRQTSQDWTLYRERQVDEAEKN